MTTAPILFDLEAAHAAFDRIEHDAGLPGDEALADIYDRYCEQEFARLEDQIAQAEYRSWLAEQCPVCEEGGGGPECDEHVIEHEAAMKRVGDL